MAENRSPDERWVTALAQLITDGQPLDRAPSQYVDARQAADWPVDRWLPGEAIRAALLAPDLRADPRGLQIRAVYIRGETDFADLQLTFPLRFDSCGFERAADWSRMMVADLDLISCAAPRLSLDGATINGALNLGRTTFTQKNGVALSIDDAHIKSSARFSTLIATGEVSAARATIGGDLDLDHATVNNRTGHAVVLDSADIKGDVILRRLTAAGSFGAVSALGTSIGGVLSLGDATLTGTVGLGDALSLDRADIKGGAHLAAMTATGAVRLVTSTLGGQLVLEGATVSNKNGVALALDGANLNGPVYLNSVTVTGAVRAVSATIDGPFTLQGATLTDEGGTALSLHAARLTRLDLTPAAIDGAIALDGAQIDQLRTPEEMRVLLNSGLSAAGWRLGDVEGSIRHDRKSAADWLSQAASSTEFVPQPWHELANVYERNGQPADARWLRWKAARGVTRTSRLGPRLIRSVYGALTGHGYYPLVAALWLVLTIMASVTVVDTHDDVFTPTDTSKVAWRTPPTSGQPPLPINGRTPCSDLKEPATCFKPALYALDNSLPGILATGQAALWTANGARGADAWVPYALGGLKIASWMLVALLLAGVTGLLRKT